MEGNPFQGNVDSRSPLGGPPTELTIPLMQFGVSPTCTARACTNADQYYMHCVAIEVTE